MGTLRNWWQRVTGQSESLPAPPAARPAAHKKMPTAPDAQAGTPATLELADAPRKREPDHVGAAGFDPYGNDAGYSKPRGWEKVDRD